MILDYIEKLINEHGSSAILSQQLSLARDEFSQLERKKSELQIQVGHLEAQLEREKLDRSKAQDELEKLKEIHAEDVLIFRTIEFRRGRRTGRLWVEFCPKCHSPASTREYGRITCSSRCGWVSDVDGQDLQEVHSGLPA
jgi:hypothetical protein